MMLILPISITRKLILEVNDNAFGEFDEMIPTNIVDAILKHSDTLCGVYLTRYQHTLNQNGIATYPSDQLPLA